MRDAVLAEDLMYIPNLLTVTFYLFLAFLACLVYAFSSASMRSKLIVMWLFIAIAVSYLLYLFATWQPY